MITDNRTFFLGLLILIIPFLGLPLLWKSIILVIVGLILMILSITWSKSDKPAEITSEAIKEEKKVSRPTRATGPRKKKSIGDEVSPPDIPF